MRLEDADEDIMTQGSTYDPTSDVDSRDSGIDDDILDGSGSGGKKKVTDGGPNLKVIFIIIAVIAVVAIGALAWAMMKKQEEKEAAELLAQLEAEAEPEFRYTAEEIESLRQNGYTGDEIEQFEIDEIPYDRKVEEAEAERAKLYDEEIKPYLDGASEEFNQLKELTWLYGPDLTYDVNQANTSWYNKQATLNLDYTKVPAKGIQCFIRLTLIERTETTEPVYMFMMVDPIRYNELPESGNIVVYVEYYVTDQGTIITELEEKRVADK